jgi:hypothetical protein
MKTILDILQKAGGWRPSLYLKIENPPYMELVIEAVDESGPLRSPVALRCALRHPEWRPDARSRDVLRAWFRGRRTHLNPFYWRNDYVAIEQWSRNIVGESYVYLVKLHEQHESFAKTWDRNLRSQGFAQAFTDKCILG